MQLAQIRYVVALYDERNFTRAAKRCNVSQPSLSNGIKSLENELGGPLFDRSNMSLTPLGKKLQPHFENALASVRKITRMATDFQKLNNARQTTTLTVSSNPVFLGIKSLRRRHGDGADRNSNRWGQLRGQ